MNPYKRLTYKQDKYNKNILEPVIYLCNRNLKKIGRLYPISEPNLIMNFNAADEISFSFYKEVDGEKCNFYNDLENLSIIQVENHKINEDMFFECTVTENDNNGSIYKTVSAKSLGYSEISQKLVTLEINTDTDIERDDYEPTILYRKNNSKSSLIHRILSYAPDYEVGHVDDTISILQRTFSWSDTYMDSCLNDICEELECIYTIDVKLNKDTGAPIRKINFYDICYCKKCWDSFTKGIKSLKRGDYWKNVINGECQNCGSIDIYDIGDNTSISINTKNLTDDIKVQVDKDHIKNCFKLKAGDDSLTNIIQGINPTGTNKILMFSDEQINMFSKELRDNWKRYLNKINDKTINQNFQNLVELQYDVLDLIKYLESEKMPTHDVEQASIDDQWQIIKNNLSTYNYKFYKSSDSIGKIYDSKITIRNFISAFLKEGYQIIANTSNISESRVDSGKYESIPKKYYCWYGTYKIYKNFDKETFIYVTIDENGQTVEIHHGVAGTTTKQSQNGLEYRVYDGSETILEYKNYLKQTLCSLLRDENIYDFETSNWHLYGINRLNSFYDAYSKCIETLELLEVSQQSEYDEDFNIERQGLITKFKDQYKKYLIDLKKIIDILEDQIFSLYIILGDKELIKKKYPPLNNTQDYNYSLRHFPSIDLALLSLKSGVAILLNDYDSDGNSIGEHYKTIGFLQGGDKGVQCLVCRSTNILYSHINEYFYCGNCNNDYEDKIEKYSDYAKNIYNWYNNNSNSDIISGIIQIQNLLRIDSPDNLGELYKELCSFIREDIYDNPNFVSEGIKSNTEIIKNASDFIFKAKKELAKSCVPQLSITTDVAALVALNDFKVQNLELKDAYKKFILGNFIRVIVDDSIYKLRIIGITYPYQTIEKLNITFSNVTKTLVGAESDINSILSQAQSMSSSFSTVQQQAQKGESASLKFEHIKNEGLNSILGYISGASNQNIIIDDKGFLCRYYDKDYDSYSDCQLKIINSNLAITKDNWKTSSLAIGYGLYNKQPVYGIWADLLVGDLMITKDLKVLNGNNSVEINETGITLTGGSITWKNPDELDIPKSGVVGLEEYIENTKKQLDKKMETWYQPTDPSINWITSDEKNEHIGDIWYCTNSARDTNKTFIYQLINGSYSWKEQEVSKELFDMADGKACIYVEKPRSYNKNDMWILEKDNSSGNDNTFPKNKKGVLLVAKNSNTCYSVLDWEEKVSYTDDSYAESVKDQLDNYKQDISTFKNKVTTALTISDIGSDYVISPKIAGGYLYITQQNRPSVEINPCGIDFSGRNGDYVFAVRNKIGNVVMGVDGNGNAYYSGSISWNNVVDAENVATMSKINEKGFQTASQVTEITKNTIRTEDIKAENLTLSGTSKFGEWELDSYGGLHKEWISSEDNNKYYCTWNGNNFEMGGYSNVLIPKPPDGSEYIYFDKVAIFRVNIDKSNSDNGIYIKGSKATFNIDDFSTNSIYAKLKATTLCFEGESISSSSAIAITSDERKKKDFEGLLEYENFFYDLEPVSFKYINGTSNRKHIGFKAQQVREAIEKNKLSTQDFGAYVNSSKDKDGELSLRYSEFIALNTHMIQKISRQIDELESRIANLENKISEGGIYE